MSTEIRPPYPPPSVNGAPQITAVDHVQLIQMQIWYDQRLANIEAMLNQVAMNQVTGGQQVMVRDISMSFSAMVGFMVKWAIASIPAAFLLLALGWTALLVFGGVLLASLR